MVTLYSPSLEYRHFTAAGPDEPWQWQADKGENYNGWKWKQSAVLGYQMPAVKFIETVGFLLETEQRITKHEESPMEEGGWGSDFMVKHIGPIAVLQITPSQKLTLQAQFTHERDYTDATIGNAHFTNRKVDTESPAYWYFCRIAFTYRLEF